ncbi:hypothetical protein M5D96_011321, partial [Drosophila gunungcola]
YNFKKITSLTYLSCLIFGLLKYLKNLSIYPPVEHDTNAAIVCVMRWCGLVCVWPIKAQFFECKPKQCLIVCPLPMPAVCCTWKMGPGKADG